MQALSLRGRGRCFGAALVGIVLAACGGGVDSGGTGAPASSFAAGPITGFGSIVVDGVHYDDRAATVRDGDGRTRSRDDLRLGMTVEVRGGAVGSDSDGNPVGTATSIVFSSALLGPVSANDTVARRLTVLGQAIDVDAATVFDTGLAGGQAAITIGLVVEVYAHLDAASGRFVATRVQARPGAAAYVLRGLVASLDTTARAFSIGPLRISYAGLAAASVPATLANGRFVRATLALAPGAGGVWTATALADGSPALEDHDEAKLEGRISAFASGTQFSVDGTPVDARAARFEGTALGLGRRVEVEGALTGGVLVATRVKGEGDEGGGGGGDEYQVRGAIASIDTAAKTFVVREVTVSYAGTVDFRRGTAADLATGRQVEARGALSGDGTRLQASRIDFRD